jgi:Right handed beta helix region/GH141 insertion domain
MASFPSDGLTAHRHEPQGGIRFIACLLCAMVASSVAAAPPLDLYVAPNGNDHWSGRMASPNAARTDGPLASLAGARDRIRRVRASATPPPGAVTVHIRGGTYRLSSPWVLAPEDSGTASAPVAYVAEPGQHPAFSGGRVLTGFHRHGRLWQCVIPEVKAGRWYFRELFVDGERRRRARSPNRGFYRVAGLLPGHRDAHGKEVPDKSGFIFKPGDLQPWHDLRDVNVILMHSWETSIHPIESVDTVSHIVRFTAPLKEWWTIGYWEKAQRYYIENTFAALDQPGEWYLDRATGVLSYYPEPGEQFGKLKIVAPTLTELVRFAGDPDAGRFVDWVTLRGLTFEDADWKLSPRGNSSTQAAVEVPAAIMADGARHCVIDSCRIAHTGIYGLWLRRGCKDCRVQRTRLWDLGAGGIRVGETQMAKRDAAESSGNRIDNNLLFDGGHVYAAGVGIWVAQSSHNVISHNEIHDFLYTGISVGWNWNDATNRCHDNVIAFNHVHHLLKGVLSDGGAIYCLGASPGSVICNNLLHDVWPYARPPFGWGIYLDATCSGYRVESNVVYHTRSGGLMFNNGGHQHVIQNNIFALSADYEIWPYWERRPNTFRRNIVYFTQGELFVPFGERSLKERLAARESLGIWDDNLYWDTAGPDRLRFFRHDWAAWRRLGLDRHSRIGDPAFVGVTAADFRLRPGSPALRMGFKPIDVSTVGLYGDPAWVNQARRVKHPKTILPPSTSR